MRASCRIALGLALALAACIREQQTEPAAHYVVGPPYQQGGIWHYPREQFEYEATGLATVTEHRDGLTADGERVDPNALTAAHPTLQLPVILRVTALDTGRQILVRANDRGPADPGRLIALSPRALALLGDPSHAPLRVRVVVEEGPSRQLAAFLDGDTAPHLAIAAAPEGEVRQEALAAPGQVVGPAPPPVASPEPAPAPPVQPPPMRMPETIVQVAPRPGALYIDTGAFATVRYAAVMQDRLRAYGAEIDAAQGDDGTIRVRIGPIGSVAAADAMLRRVFADGYPGARIVAE
jgi:rare lipoprotein A